jgi:sugar-specific transcriptional regulator TrmB
MDLGLTLVQVKTYITLCKLENATVKSISKTSNLARQDVYRIMPTLQTMGLAEKIIAKPIRYRAIPIKDGISSLLQHKTRQHAELEKKTTTLLKNLNNLGEGEAKIVLQEEEPQFIVTSEMTLLFKRLMNGTKASQTNIDSIGTWESYEGVVSHGFPDFMKALKRGVKIRSITEKPLNEKLMPICVKTLKKHPLYEVRFISAPAPVTMSILDKKEMNISISLPDGKAVSSLWSNNPAILALATNYFEEIWKASRGKRENTAESYPSNHQALQIKNA